jgi:hypothetical protein
MTLFQQFGMATLIVVACIVFGPFSAYSQTPVNINEAVIVANNWLHLSQEVGWGWSKAPDFAPQSAIPISENGQLVGYCFTVPAHGYLVTPAYRELAPITAYSFESYFDPKAEDGFCAMIRQQLFEKEQLVATCLATPNPPAEWAPALNQMAQDDHMWHDYSGTYAQFTAAFKAENDTNSVNIGPDHHNRPYDLDDMTPLTTSSWHQGTPYNSFCPMGDGGRTVVGCVATACAQILYYWQQPVAGTGSHSYTWGGDHSCGSTTPNQSLAATFSDSYDWANMLPSYSGSEPQAQIDAVSELCYEVGVALNMDYGHCGSGANTASVQNILPAYFGYVNEIDIQNRNGYSSASTWFAMLQQDLNLNRPMQYRIASHSIVCDGWRISGTDQVHMNYGWADSHNAWYTVDALYCTWSGCSPSVEYVVRHIHPTTVNAAINIVAPNGGETWMVGENHTIQWTSQNVTGNVMIELNRNYPTGSWETLSPSAANNGAFAWTVTDPACATARARITSVSNPTVSDISDADFSAQGLIPPQVVIQSTSGALRLNWTNVGAPYYRVYSATSPAGPYTSFVGSTADTTYLDTSTALDRKFYAVTASTTP